MEHFRAWLAALTSRLSPDYFYCRTHLLLVAPPVSLLNDPLVQDHDVPNSDCYHTWSLRVNKLVS